MAAAGKPPFNSLPVAFVVAVPPRGRTRHYGLYSANEGLLNALIRYSSISEIHLFVRDTDIEEIKESWHPVVAGIKRPLRMRTMPMWNLPDCMATTDYAAMHWGDPMIYTLTDLRNAFARRPFPVTGITHSLVGDHYQTGFGRLAVSHVRPYDAVICSSNAAATALRRMLRAGQILCSPEDAAPRNFAAELPVIPLGVEPEPQRPVTKQAAREMLGLPRDQPIILCLARFAPITKMDLHPCLLALQRLIQDHGHHNLMLVAAGSIDRSDVYFEVMVSRIKALGLSNNVLLKADFPNEEKRALLAAADVFLSPSDNFQESFGIAPVEAMLSGVPCVLSDWNGYRELVRDGETGFLIPTYSADIDSIFVPRTIVRPAERRLYMAQATAVDVTRMTAVLDRLLRDNALRQRVGEAGRLHAEMHFVWEQIVPAYQQLWERLYNAIPDDEMGHMRRPLLRGQSLDQLFEHYATRRLDPELTVRSTSRGDRVISCSETPGCYASLTKLIDLRLVRAILHTAVQGISFGDLKSKLSGCSPLLEFTLLWMLKHDFLEVSDRGGT